MEIINYADYNIRQFIKDLHLNSEVQIIREEQQDEVQPLRLSAYWLIYNQSKMLVKVPVDSLDWVYHIYGYPTLPVHLVRMQLFGFQLNWLQALKVVKGLFCEGVDISTLKVQDMSMQITWAESRNYSVHIQWKNNGSLS